jgi:hypothetical protein
VRCRGALLPSDSSFARHHKRASEHSGEENTSSIVRLRKRLQSLERVVVQRAHPSPTSEGRTDVESTLFFRLCCPHGRPCFCTCGGGRANSHDRNQEPRASCARVAAKSCTNPGRPADCSHENTQFQCATLGDMRTGALKCECRHLVTSRRDSAQLVPFGTSGYQYRGGATCTRSSSANDRRALPRDHQARPSKA